MPARRQTTEPGCVTAAAPVNVLGEEALEPELALLPEGEAKRVQSAAVVPLLTLMDTAELVAEMPAVSVVFAEREWAPLESVAVLRLKVQLLVPEALE